MNHLMMRWRFFAVAAAGATLDLLTKWGAFWFLGADAATRYHAEEFGVIPGFFTLKATTNRGSLWGLFSDYPRALLAVTLAIFVVLVVLAMLEWGKTRGMQIALGLFCAGAVGNLADRIIYGHVRDFLDVYVGNWHWPTFNVADMCICAGAAVFLWSEIRAAREARSEVTTEEVV
jgi:signal peptidase II